MILARDFGAARPADIDDVHQVRLALKQLVGIVDN